MAEREITVEVVAPPKIQLFPAELNGVAGQPLSVKCNATGKPAPEYSWVYVNEDHRRFEDVEWRKDRLESFNNCKSFSSSPSKLLISSNCTQIPNE